MKEVPANLIQHACIAADVVAMQPTMVGADRTRAIITRALEALLNNGLIQVTPEDQWPQWFVIDPPYELPAPLPFPFSPLGKKP